MTPVTAHNELLVCLDATLTHYSNNPTNLLQMLRETQEQHGWIAPEAMTYLARRLNLPRARVEGMVGFYSFLHPQPVGQYWVLFSDNITDRMMGNLDLLDDICHKLWVERGKVSAGGLVSIDTTSCTGLCDQGPAIPCLRRTKD